LNFVIEPNSYSDAFKDKFMLNGNLEKCTENIFVAQKKRDQYFQLNKLPFS
jgi:hypothetical protein